MVAGEACTHRGNRVAPGVKTRLVAARRREVAQADVLLHPGLAAVGAFHKNFRRRGRLDRDAHRVAIGGAGIGEVGRRHQRHLRQAEQMPQSAPGRRIDRRRFGCEERREPLISRRSAFAARLEERPGIPRAHDDRATAPAGKEAAHRRAEVARAPARTARLHRPCVPGKQGVESGPALHHDGKLEQRLDLVGIGTPQAG